VLTWLQCCAGASCFELVYGELVQGLMNLSLVLNLIRVLDKAKTSVLIAVGLDIMAMVVVPLAFRPRTCLESFSKKVCKCFQ